MRCVVLVNPAAGRGQASHLGQRLFAELRHHSLAAELWTSHSPAELEALAHQAVRAGARCLVVVGGDGTLNTVAQAYLPRPALPVAPLPALALLPAGTGCDFARAAPRLVHVAELARRLSEDATTPADLGVVELQHPEHGSVRRAFVNVVSVGISTAINRRVAGLKWLGGRLAFLVATLIELPRYRQLNLRVEIDGHAWHEGPTLIGAIANGRSFGGGMRIAPHSQLTDGALDAVLFGGQSVCALLALLPKVYLGTHVQDTRVLSRRGTSVVITAAADAPPVWVDVDGECPGHLPLRLTLVPGGLPLLGCL